MCRATTLARRQGKGWGSWMVAYGYIAGYGAASLLRVEVQRAYRTVPMYEFFQARQRHCRGRFAEASPQYGVQ